MNCFPKFHSIYHWVQFSSFISSAAEMLLKLILFQKRRKNKKITYKSRANAFIQQNDSEPKFRKLLHSFCDTTKINGFHYLRKGKTTDSARYCLKWNSWNKIVSEEYDKFFRVFWVFIILLMVVFGATLIHLLAGAYNENPATIVQLSPRFTSLNPFPSITVCPNEPFIYSKIVKLMENA